MDKKPTIKRSEENPEPLEIIAEAIITISKAVKNMESTRLTKRALLLLIQDNCSPVGRKYEKKKLTINQIEEVIDSISSLHKQYVKP